MNTRYALLMAALVGFVSGLSSIPNLDNALNGSGWRALFNVLHAPLFAALAFCCYKTLSKDGARSWSAAAVAFISTVGFAAVDEWHQSFVIGRDGSISDLLVDVVGITIMLVVLLRRPHLRTPGTRLAPALPDNRHPETQ